MVDTILVSYDNTNGRDASILIVGRKQPNQSVDIINAFQGRKAENLYKKLITVVEKESKNEENS